MKARREEQERNLKRRAKLEKPTLHDKKMMIHPLDHHRRR